MTRRRQTTPLVPLGPSHRRLWRTLWRRCSCGLPAPCLDRRLPSPPPPFPRRGGSGVQDDPADARRYAGSSVQIDPADARPFAGSRVQIDPADARPYASSDVWRVWGPDAATRPAPLLGRPVTPFPMRRDER
jgi:hypothetical protein